jgi:O-antigen/teichoic acid export membrane protein
MLLTRLLPKEEFGLWAFFLSVYTLFDMVRSGLLNNAAIKFYTAETPKEELVQIEKSTMQLGLIISFLAALFPILYFAFGMDESQPKLQPLANGVIVVSVVSIIPTAAMWFLQAKQNFKKILAIRMTVQSSFFLIVASGYFWGIDLKGVFYAYTISYVLAALVAMNMRVLNWKGVFSSMGTYSKRILSFGGYSMGTLLGSNLLRNSDTYIIMAMRNAVSVATYSVPNRIMTLLDIPIQAFSAADYPRMVGLVKNGTSEDIQKQFNKGLGFALLVVWPACMVVFLAAKWLVILIAGGQYENSYLILRIFAIYAALLPLDRYSGLMLDALGRPQRNLRKVIFMLVANVALDILVLSLGYGLEAVAGVSLATYSIGIILGYSAIKDVVRLQIISSLKSAFFVLKSKIYNKSSN